MFEAADADARTGTPVWSSCDHRSQTAIATSGLAPIACPIAHASGRQPGLSAFTDHPAHCCVLLTSCTAQNSDPIGEQRLQGRHHERSASSCSTHTLANSCIASTAGSQLLERAGGSKASCVCGSA